MERGHLPDTTHHGVVESSWAPGEPEPRGWLLGGIKFRGNEVMPLSAYRCQARGFVEFYARLD